MFLAWIKKNYTEFLYSMCNYARNNTPVLVRIISLLASLDHELKMCQNIAKTNPNF